MKTIILQTEVNTGLGVGFFPVPVRLVVDEKANIKSWEWQTINSYGKSIWIKPEGHAALKVSKMMIYEKLEKLTGKV